MVKKEVSPHKQLPTTIPQLDIIKESQSLDHMMVVVFGQSSSVNYALAVEFASGAHKYGKGKLGSKDLHVAAFSKTKEQAARAAALIKLVGNWKSCQVYTHTRLLSNPYSLAQVLECYLQSLSNKEPKAHCHWSYREYNSGRDYLISCKQLQGWMHLLVRDQDRHCASLKNRVHALSIEKGCDWCPHYRLDDFKEF